MACGIFIARPETASHLNLKSMNTSINTLTANCKAFAIEQGFTKQQTIAFTILALFDRGYDIARAVEIVCGPQAMAEIAGVDYTAQTLLDAVRSSFFS